jgi:hypothetical protein
MPLAAPPTVLNGPTRRDSICASCTHLSHTSCGSVGFAGGGKKGSGRQPNPSRPVPTKEKCGGEILLSECEIVALKRGNYARGISWKHC